MALEAIGVAGGTGAAGGMDAYSTTPTPTPPPGGTGAPITNSDIVNLANMQGQVATDNAQQQAENVIAAGDRQETNAYDTAAAIARSNAQLEAVSGGIQSYQQGYQLKKTLGTQQADQAASGFAAGGSSLNLMRDSKAQGAIDRSMIQLQTNINEGAYEEQANAYGAESTATTTAGTTAAVLGAAAGAAAVTAQTNSTNFANNLITNQNNYNAYQSYEANLNLSAAQSTEQANMTTVPYEAGTPGSGYPVRVGSAPSMPAAGTAAASNIANAQNEATAAQNNLTMAQNGGAANVTLAGQIAAGL